MIDQQFIDDTLRRGSGFVGGRVRIYKPHDDGSSWAEWCDDFLSRRKTHTVTHKGYTAIQSGVNYHVFVCNPEKEFSAHFSFTKHKSKRQLKRLIDDIRRYKNV